MEIQLTWAAVGIVLSVLLHAFYTVRSAATFKAVISVKIDAVVLSLQKVDNELEKRDEKISAAFKKIDHISERLYKVEARSE